MKDISPTVNSQEIINSQKALIGKKWLNLYKRKGEGVSFFCVNLILMQKFISKYVIQNVTRHDT